MKNNLRMEKLVIVIVGIVFLLFFSYMTSPLFPWCYGWDSAFFQFVGSGMTKGYIPYRDFFDMKGPWLFLIEYVGQLICYGRIGCFIIQVINMTVVLLVYHAIFVHYYNGKGLIKKLIILLPIFLILSSTMEGGNLTEELSLSILLIPLFFALDFIKNKRKEHSPKKAIIYGVCFGILALLRITNAVLICAIVFTITVFLIINKKWNNLLLNMIAFILGCGIAFLPPLLYFGYYGEIKEMLYCTFIFGFIYGTESFQFNNGMFYILTMLVSILGFMVSKNRNLRMWTLVITNIIGMVIVLGMGNSTLHDYTLIIPGVMLGVLELFDVWENRLYLLNLKRKIIIFGLLILVFLYPTKKMFSAGLNILHQISDKTTYNNVIEMVNCIPEEEKNSVLGYEVPVRWYAISDIIPYNRYCGWQEHYMILSPKIEGEIKEMFAEVPPKWLVTKATASIENKYVVFQLENHYKTVNENDDLKLYQRIN